MSSKCQPCGPGRSVVELTIAIHYVFNAPMDKILWDAGQHAYAHKILTGRRSLFHTIKQKNGLSGFTSRYESEYDPFGAGHGCNSLSAGLGIASICSSPSCMSNYTYVIQETYSMRVESTCFLGVIFSVFFHYYALIDGLFV